MGRAFFLLRGFFLADRWFPKTESGINCGCVMRSLPAGEKNADRFSVARTFPWAPTMTLGGDGTWFASTGGERNFGKSNKFANAKKMQKKNLHPPHPCVDRGRGKKKSAFGWIVDDDRRFLTTEKKENCACACFFLAITVAATTMGLFLFFLLFEFLFSVHASWTAALGGKKRHAVGERARRWIGRFFFPPWPAGGQANGQKGSDFFSSPIAPPLARRQRQRGRVRPKQTAC